MKKFLALLLAAVLAFSFTACGSTTESDSDTNSTGITEFVIADGIPAFTFDEPQYEGVIPEDADESCTHYFTSDKEGKIRSFKVFEYEKTDDTTLEERLKAEAESLSACCDIIEFQGVECGFYSTSYEVDGAWYYDNSWIFELEDKFVEISKYYPTKEVQIADSDYYLWIPEGYEEDASGSNDVLITSYKYKEQKAENTLPFAEFYVLKLDWMNSTYADQKEYFDSIETDIPYTEEQYKGWQAEGFSLKSVKEMFSLQYEITDSAEFTEDKQGVNLWVFENNYTNEEGTDMTNVRMFIPYDNHYAVLKFVTEKADWTHQGLAIANSIHKK